MAEVDLVAELAITGSDGTYGRDISDRWNIGGDRAFGGYGAAIALAATMVEVEVLRRGRRVAAARATAVQGGRRALTMTTWLSTSSRPARTVVPEPDEPDRNWAGEKWPVLGAMTAPMP